MIKMDDLTRIIDVMEQQGLYKADFKFGNARIYLRRDAVPMPAAAAAIPGPALDPVETPKSEYTLISLNVGIFYRSITKDGGLLKKDGDEVKTNEIIGYIEVMRVMHDVKSPVKGRIRQFLCPDSSVVEYGQQLVTIDLAEPD